MIPHRSPEQSRLEPPSFSFLEYDKAREKIPESTRASVDAWREEVLAICQAHGVDHPSKLVLVETHASTEILARVQKLLDDILYVFEHQTFPPEDREHPVDDREYVIPLGPSENQEWHLSSSDPDRRCCVGDQQGHVYFVDKAVSPQYLCNEQGERHLLPTEVHPRKFLLLGSRLVLVGDKTETLENGDERYAGMILFDAKQGTILRELFDVEENNTHITAFVNDKMHTFCSPVREDGTVNDEVTFFLSRREETHIEKITWIAGRPFFIESSPLAHKKVGVRFYVYTADNEPFGDSDGYEFPPVLCAKDDGLVVIARNAEKSGWWIYDEHGNPLQPVALEDNLKKTDVENAMYLNGSFIFSGYDPEHYCDVVFNEEGEKIWSTENDRGSIKCFYPQGSTFIFKTETTHAAISEDDYEATITTYRDHTGAQITNYHSFERWQEPPIAMNHAFIFGEDIDGYYKIRYGLSGHDSVVLARFEELYEIKRIDAYRFYVIGTEKKEDGTSQLAKRVYDVRTAKPRELPESSEGQDDDDDDIILHV